MKCTYFFGNGKADGNAQQKDLLGGKGANLAEMTNIGIPVPPGFTISTQVCKYYYDHNSTYPDSFQNELKISISSLESITDKLFGNPKTPLLVSVRSGAPVSMPGMMDTVLNLGLTDSTIIGLIEQTNNEWFAYDSYRRFIQMFGNVVLKIEHEHFEKIIESLKKEAGVELDTELSCDHLKTLVERYKTKILEKTGKDFPQDPQEQLYKAINAVFGSWNNNRAIEYRNMYDLPHNMGTAVNVQSMVFGNMGNDSGTGVAFTRDPSNGKKHFYGEFLMNAQGEDVVAGIRTPLSIEKLSEENPKIYQELTSVATKLENHYADMQDIEFTIEKGKLYLLQTRNANRTAFAEIRSAVEMVEEGLIDRATAIKRINPSSLTSLLAPIFNKEEKNEAITDNKVLSTGLPASPGAASGMITLSADKAVEWKKLGKKVLLVRHETSPEDINGMLHAEGILTSRGGMTSHAAVVARGMNRPCIVGCSSLTIDYHNRTVNFSKESQNFSLKEGDFLSIDGFTGEVIQAKLKTINSEIEQVFIDKSMEIKNSLLAQQYGKIMDWTSEVSILKVRANADTVRDAHVAREYGARGIGLCRTEHMFFQEERLKAMREMILAKDLSTREKILAKILPYQREDFKEIFREMAGFPVTIRLLDPPLHEFLPHDKKTIEELAQLLGVDINQLYNKINSLKEFNPMLGHRGCRLGITFPEITAMQTRAILEAATELTKENIAVLPEIMIPLVGNALEFENQAEVIRKVAKIIAKETGKTIKFKIGTMIEVPRAALTADQIAKTADFFSFGTNDLTQLTTGISRDDSESFLPHYIELGIYAKDPFAVFDQDGVGELVRIATQKGKSTNSQISLGICGEHGGEPLSIDFFHRTGLNYVSCSPYRVPIARLAAAQVAL